MIEFACLILIMFIIVNRVNLSMWTASLVQMNVGVIVVIWPMTSLLQALFDLMIFKLKLT